MKKCMNAGGYIIRLQPFSLVILLVLVFVAAPVSAQDSAPASALAPEAAQILADVNQARLDNGLPALALHPALVQAAQAHVDDIIANGNWGHYGSDGSNVQMRTARAGYGSSWVSENWVAVSSTEQAIVWWMNDWIHRVNILSAHWDEIGVGAGIAPNGYWIFVTDFGNSDGSAPQPVSSPTDLTPNSSLEVAVVPLGGMDYTIVPGDTLLGIAIRHGLDWQDIAIANHMDEGDLLQVGGTLRLPAVDGTGKPISRIPVEGIASAGKQRYTIAAGDTLSTIALRYDVTWQEIAAVNGMGETDLLHVGQEIVLPASLDRKGESVPDAGAAEIADAADAEGTAATGDPPGGDGSGSSTGDGLHRDAQSAMLEVTAGHAEYRVRAGDTLLGIALRLNVTVDDLLGANGITENDFLQIGQVLTVPGAAGKEVSLALLTSEMSATAYTVQAGDTIFGISLRLGVNWQEILSANDLSKESILQPGQSLVIP